MRKNNFLISSIFLVFVILLSFQCSAYLKSSVQGLSPGILSGGFASSGGQWIPDRTMCEAGQDFIVQIEPFGCEPAIVRSDLLEEQNIPVLCQLSATRMNPFIDVSVIDSISFSGATLPNSISGIGFYPAQAALGVPSSLNSPVLNNIGYAVIVLKKQPNESSMPEFISGNLTARLQYDIKKAYGIGDTRFYLPEISDNNLWESSKKQYGFWNGRGYLRADSVSPDEARISLYTDTLLIKTVSLKKGEESPEIYLPGFDCFVGAKLRLEDLVSPDTRAVIKVNEDTLQLVNGEKFLENKCTLNDITRRGLTKKVAISCTEDEGVKRFELVLTPKVSLTIDGTMKDYAVGDFLYEGDQIITKGKPETRHVYVYLAYVGTKGDSEKLDDLYVMLVSTSSNPAKLSESDIARYSDRAEGLYSNIYRDKAKPLTVLLKTATEWGARIVDLFKQNSDLKYIPHTTDDIWSEKYLKEVADNKFAGKDVYVPKFASPVNSVLTSAGISSTYYQSASQDYSKVRTSFGAEKDIFPPYVLFGEESFIQNIRLAYALNQKGDIEILCKEFEKTASSRLIEVDEICNNKLKQSSATSSSIELSINAKQIRISLEDVRAPSFEEFGVRLKVTLPDKSIQYLDLIKDKTVYVNEGDLSKAVQYAQLISINKDTISMNINGTRVGFGALYQSNTVTLKKGTPDAFGTAYVFDIVEIYDKKNAKVSVIPMVNRAQTEANFSFYIGIEKRGIQLSPEQTKQMIKNLNETIAKWKDINGKLTKVVEGMNGVCLATGLALTVKNFVSNVGGKSIARQEVMTGKGGWNERCADAVSTRTLDGNPVPYKTVEQCIMNNSAQIDKDVDALYQIMQQQDKDMKILQEACPPIKGQGIFFDEVFNTKCIQEEYSAKLYTELENSLKDYSFNVSGKPVFFSQILPLIKANKVSVEDMRKIQLYARTGTSGDLSSLSKKELDKIFTSIYVSGQQEIALQKLANGFQMSSDKVTILTDPKKTQILPYKGLTYEDVKNKYPCDAGDIPGGFCSLQDSDKIAVVATPNGKEYVATLENKGGKLLIKNAFEVNTNNWNVPTELSNVVFEVMNQQAYTGRGYKSPVLRCYENEPYKGTPAITPVNTKDGWYVAISQTLPAFGNIGSVDKSGRVTRYHICNVWENGIEENRLGDDMCTEIILTTGQTQVGGLDAAASKKLIDEAGKAVEAAQKKCQTGKAGDVFSWGNAKNVRMGAPAVDMPDLQCTNFMSPSDCKILFNVCDPVVCPSSRCNYGGKYPVQDVIQSGIVGSILLCAPNFVGFGGDIYVPVCLSGIRAGIEGLLSVFESYRDCLQNSLDTGKMTGVCDEIFSIHLCDLFWKNAIPFAKMIIPKTIELIMGKSTTGGGEYLSVQNAWTAAGQSVDYFAKYYAAESYAAFKAKVVQGVTDEVCKTYISGSYPEGGKILDTLTNAKSPPQFTGTFQEIPFTTATNPPTSQYKVYYHIYAGTDSRAYYQVYLTDVPSGSYYQDTGTKLVVPGATGYIPQGGKVDETKDFIAISGYKKMCIVINGKEECGFQNSMVSSSFALDYVAEQYVIDQASQTGITSESDCVSGTASAWSLATISVAGAANELISPQISNRGIIRTCANENPGSAMDTDSTKPRWVSVGYCGRQELKCWLDTQSVKNAVKWNYSAQVALSDVTKNFIAQMEAEGKYLSYSDFLENITEINKLKEGKNFAGMINSINRILNKVSMNNQKGKLYLLRAFAYGELAKQGFTAAQKTIVDETSDIVSKCIAYASALGEISILSLNSKYSANSENQAFAYKLKNDGLITAEEYADIQGESGVLYGIFNPEKDMSFVLNLIKEKYGTNLCDSRLNTALGGVTSYSTSKKCVAYSEAIGELTNVINNKNLYSETELGQIFADKLSELKEEGYLVVEYDQLLSTLMSGSVMTTSPNVLDALKSKDNTECITTTPDAATGRVTAGTGSHGTASTTFSVNSDTLGKISTNYGIYIKSASTAFGIEENLIKSIIYVESKGDPEAVSSTGSKGLMQLVQSTAVADMIDKTKGKCYNKCTNYYGAFWETDPKTNIMMGACYLACLKDVYKIPIINNDWTNWITSYNAGPTKFAAGGSCYNKNLDECAGLVTEQKEYAGKVLKVYETLTGVSQAGVSGVITDTRTSLEKFIAQMKDKNDIAYATIKVEGDKFNLISAHTCEKAEYTLFKASYLLGIESDLTKIGISYKTFKGAFSKNGMLSLDLRDIESGEKYFFKMACVTNNGMELKSLYSEVFSFSLNGAITKTILTLISCEDKKQEYLSAIGENRNLDLNSKYSDNKNFVDRIYYEQGLITEAEYNALSGKGTFVPEKDMGNVLRVLESEYKKLCGPYATLGYQELAKSLNIIITPGACIAFNYTLYYDGLFGWSAQKDSSGEIMKGIISEKIEGSFIGKIPISSFPNKCPAIRNYLVEIQCYNVQTRTSSGEVITSEVFPSNDFPLNLCD